MSMGPPRFYDPLTVGMLYLERAALVAGEAAALRAAERVREAREDRERIAAFGIDCQVAFCIPGASLFVPGAVEDTVRVVEWLYRNLARITTLVLSLDTHTVHQIFHPSAWLDEEGHHPAPFTVITTDDVRRGRWRPLLRPPGFPDFMSRARVVRPGPLLLEGRAWSGRAPVTEIEVSTDDGHTWHEAVLEQLMSLLATK